MRKMAFYDWVNEGIDANLFASTKVRPKARAACRAFAELSRVVYQFSLRSRKPRGFRGSPLIRFCILFSNKKRMGPSRPERQCKI